MDINFRIDRFKGDSADNVPAIALDHMALWSCLRCLVDLDVQYLTTHPEAPNLYDAGIPYQEEPPGEENWLDIPSVLAQRWGDCEELACWRVAELRVRHGVQAEPWFVWNQTPGKNPGDAASNLYHIQVKYPEGAPYFGVIEDPCRKLGMR